jgi:RNA polymerase sigma-70 factor (ECF subfamily)
VDNGRLTTGNVAPSEAELMACVADGSMPALAELVRRHQDKVLALSYRMLGRWDLAEDVAQEAFLRVYRGAAQYEPNAAFTTWLYRVVVNLCLDTKRKVRRAPLPLPDDTPVQADDRDPLEAREQAERVQQAVAGLPERQRAVLVLHRYQGLSHREIAQAMGWSESAVESLLVRAYANLRKAVASLGQE